MIDLSGADSEFTDCDDNPDPSPPGSERRGMARVLQILREEEANIGDHVREDPENKSLLGAGAILAILIGRVEREISQVRVGDEE